MRLRGLCKLLDGRDWQWEKLGLALVGRALLSEALVQLSADGRGCAPSLGIVWPERPSPGVCCWAGITQEAEAVRDLMWPESELRAQGIGAQHAQTQPPCMEPPL